MDAQRGRPCNQAIVQLKLYLHIFTYLMTHLTVILSIKIVQPKCDKVNTKFIEKHRFMNEALKFQNSCQSIFEVEVSTCPLKFQIRFLSPTLPLSYLPHEQLYNLNPFP